MATPRKPGRPPRIPRASRLRFELRLTAPERARWQRAADKREMSLAEWVRAACEIAAED